MTGRWRFGPDYPEALNNRGNTLSDIGWFDEALQSYDRAVALRPDYAEAWNNRSLDASGTRPFRGGDGEL